MDATVTRPSRTLHGSRLLAFVGVLIGAGVAGVLRVLWTPDLPGWVAAIGVASAVMACVAAVGVVKPAVLTLKAHGLTLQPTFGRAVEVAWRDVESFYVLIVRGRSPGRFVVWKLKPGVRPTTPPLWRLGGRLTGVDGGLTGPWLQSPKALVDLLEEWRTSAT
jgi:hypothetical protein